MRDTSKALVIDKIWTAVGSYNGVKEEHTIFGERDDIMEHMHNMGYMNVSVSFVRAIFVRA